MSETHAKYSLLVPSRDMDVTVGLDAEYIRTFSTGQLYG